ncbi:histidine phosphatase family protein [Hyphomicrobium sp.]|jgi:broad specificity phosphatase PhoE|uniref:histidine phosphatase family protein n=1 Tax=Hyphomicrobium sp. TaxID=82 RepID=UPI003566B6A6
MPPRLTLVANASTPAVRAAAFPLDEGLDDYGRRDAAAMAAEFRNSVVVLSSPAKRALETAAALGLDPEIDASLRDLDLGSWAGRTLNSVAESDPDALSSWLSDPESAPHGGETVEGLFARISIWLQTMSAREERIVAVTHPAVIRVAILAAIHAGPASFWNIDIAPLSVVELTSNGRRWALKSIRN